MTVEMTSEQYATKIDNAMPESELQEFVRLAAKHLGWLYFHPHDSRHSPSGFPDCVMVRGDRLIFAELKRQKVKRLRPEQVVWADALASFVCSYEITGVSYYEWRPSDRDAILEVLAQSG